MTSRMIALVIPTVCGFWDAWLVASFRFVFVDRPKAAPAAATRAVRMTAMPVAVSQPKNAAPNFMPPNVSFSR